MSDIAVASRSQNNRKNQMSLKVPFGANSVFTQRRQEVSHNSLGTSYCRIPAKQTGILLKTSALIEWWNRADWEVPVCFARGAMGRYRTL